MAMIGLDVQQVRSLATSMDKAAGEIDDIMKRISSELSNAQWEGQDAVHFRGEWSGTHTAALRQAVEGLRSAANAAKKNADEQENVSNS